MKAQHPLRIAILECDTPADGTRAKYGSYGGVFEALLAAGVSGFQKEREGSERSELGRFKLTYWDVVSEKKYPRVEDVDGVLLTGSRHAAFGDDEWIVKLVEFTKGLLFQQERVRVIGVCFGHQIVGRAMGVEVGKSEEGWETSVMPVNLTEKGKQLLGRDVLSIHQMHRDIVFDCPRNVELLGSSPRCKVQGMYVKNRLITVQGHPEFSKEIVTELLETRHKQGIFDDEVFKDGLARVGKDHDGVVVAQAFLRFLLED